MKSFRLFLMVSVYLLVLSCDSSSHKKQARIIFPSNLVHFKAHSNNPLFKGSGLPSDWDENIRERGFILYEDSIYHLWYTGYKDGDDQMMTLGYATSQDGMMWSRYAQNPIYDSLWTEDIMVIKSGDTYHMFAEGKNDIAHRLTSLDRIHWQDQGHLDIRYTDGRPLSQGPYGTPTVYIQNDIWYLYYERNDEAIWLATSKDLKVWTNLQDEPVLKKGPEPYDRYGVAMNQVIKYHDKYYGYYHGTPVKDWSDWNTNVAVSDDLIHWTKYTSNPILVENKSSGIMVHDGVQYRLYTMHPEICVHFPVEGSK